MSDVVQSLRQALQDVVAPELREHRVLLTALDSKINSRTAELRAEIGGMRTELRGEINTVRAELDKVKLAVQSGFEKLQHGLETAVLRGEVSTVRELADLRSRVERIEDHLKLRQDAPGIQRQQ